jgi:hypothetical protein
MPKISLGPCLWRYAPGAEPSAALVTRVNRETVSVIVFPPDSRGGSPRDGVRHSSDPRVPKLATSNDTGVWDYCEDHRPVKVK